MRICAPLCCLQNSYIAIYVLKAGVNGGNRTLTAEFTARSADHYTTITLAGYLRLELSLSGLESNTFPEHNLGVLNWNCTSA